MQSVRVGIREFREKLSSFLESSTPVAIMRHGETVGFYIPARRKRKEADLEALRRAGEQLDALRRSSRSRAGEAAGRNVEMLVLDANILVRAVLGRRVRTIIANYGSTVDFFAPDVAFAEARRHLPNILLKRRIPAEPGMALLDSLGEVIQAVEFDTYAVFEDSARERLFRRDLHD